MDQLVIYFGVVLIDMLLLLFVTMKRGGADTVLYVGPMFSGKTNAVIRDLKSALLKGEVVAMIKHGKDTRYSRQALVRSHDHCTVHAIVVDSLEQDPASLPPGVTCIGVDEGQFFHGLHDFCRRCNARGISVRVAACNTRTDRSPFPLSDVGRLVEWGATVSQCFATCVCCGSERATLTRLAREDMDDHGTVVGGAERYVAVCMACEDAPITPDHLAIVDKGSRAIKNFIVL